MAELYDLQFTREELRLIYGAIKATPRSRERTAIRNKLAAVFNANEPDAGGPGEILDTLPFQPVP